MITPRQKLRPNSDAPVLFSLPNLRKRSAIPATAATTSIPDVVPVAATLRVDAPSAMTNSEKPAVMSPATKTSPQVEQTSTNSQPGSGRSWMERIGSRLILLVTLMVIVVAAVITGQRMPASKSDNWNQATVTQSNPANPTAEPSQNEIQADIAALSEISTGEAITALPSPNSKSAAPVARVSTLATPTQTSSPMTSGPSSTSAYKPVNESKVQPAVPETPSVFNVVSVQSPKSSSSDTPATASNHALDIESLPLAPPLSTATPSPSTSPSTQPTSRDPQTSTPNAPVVDPEVLLPWLKEHETAPKHAVTATPNPITDWSRYLPAPAVDPGIRPVSATMPNVTGVMTNPYNK